MRITLDIPDEFASAIDDYLSTQTRPVIGPDGRPTVERIYATVEDFIEQQLASMVEAILKANPPQSVKRHFDAIANAEKAIQNQIRSRVRRA